MVVVVLGVASVFGFRMLRTGGKVAFTTTTVFGLAVDEEEVEEEVYTIDFGPEPEETLRPVFVVAGELLGPLDPRLDAG